METPESEVAGTPARRASRWCILRTVGLVLLVLCLVVVGAGSVLLSSRMSRPAAVNPNPPITVAYYQPITQTQQTAPTGATPAAHGPDTCNCAGTRLTVSTVPLPPGGAPHIGGQVMLVSLSRQWLWAFDNGALAYATPVTTGRPDLPTPTGIFSISQKIAGTWFISPWPVGSPYYYPSVWVNYAMLFLSGGYFIHDAPWRHYFGPGTNVPHTNPDGTQETGSHGCVEVSASAGAWLYDWAGYGATVDIVD
jgi:L,D-transpeptidase-like protein